jgi:hypothetical protein
MLEPNQPNGRASERLVPRFVDECCKVETAQAAELHLIRRTYRWCTNQGTTRSLTKEARADINMVGSTPKV